MLTTEWGTARYPSCRDKGRMWGRVGAWCLSWWQRDQVGTAWSKQVARGRGQAQGPLIHSTPPLVPTGPWAASTSMAMIPRFGRQNSLGLDLSVDEELSRSFEPCLNDQNRYGHAEPTEGSLCPSTDPSLPSAGPTITGPGW